MGQTREQKVIKQLSAVPQVQKLTPISEGMFMPNHSGIKSHPEFKSAMNLTVPIGTILAYGNATAPTGFLLCNGTAVSRTTYAALFAIVSTSFGVGDGVNTFNTPNLVQKFPRGNTTAGTTGGSATHAHGGCTDSNNLGWCCSNVYLCGTSIQAVTQLSHNHSIQSSNHLPPYQEVVWIIKY